MRPQLLWLLPLTLAAAFAAPPDPQTSDTQTCTSANSAVIRCPALGSREVVRTLVAIEKTGASGTPGGENFAVDFFITRPAIGPRVRCGET